MQQDVRRPGVIDGRSHTACLVALSFELMFDMMEWNRTHDGGRRQNNSEATGRLALSGSSRRGCGLANASNLRQYRAVAATGTGGHS